MNVNPQEPVRSIGRWVAAIVGGSAGLTASTLSLLTAFHVAIDPIQIAAITGFVGTLAGIIAPLVGAKITREKVTPWIEPETPQEPPDTVAG